MNNEAFRPSQNEAGTPPAVSVSVTGTSGQTDISALNGTMLRISNQGTGTLFYAFSDTTGQTVTATNGSFLPTGTTEIVTRPEKSKFFIAISGTTCTVNLTPGVGR